MSDEERKGAFYTELPLPSGMVQPTQFPGLRIFRGYTIPSWVDPESNIDLGVCKGCGAQIAWALTKNGKRAPIDKAGTNHFATCPKAESFRRK